MKLTPEILLAAYSRGLFPMADSANSKEVYWYDPPMRGQLSIDSLHVPKSLKRFLRKNPYVVTANKDFKQVIQLCAEKTSDRAETWISGNIIDAFLDMHRLGVAHSVEVWDRDTKDIVGGIYGVSVGSVFCGESMFSRRTGGSKIALVYLVAYLQRQGYRVFDTQYVNDHLKQFGVYETSYEDYKEILSVAIHEKTEFYSADFLSVDGVSLDLPFDLVLEFLQSINHTSNTG